MPPRSKPRAASEAVRQALAHGRVFAAYDLARAGLEAHPEDDRLRLLASLALIRTGAVEAARQELAQAEVARSERSGAGRPDDQSLLLAETLEALGQEGRLAHDLERALALRLERAAAGGGFADLARAASLAHELGDQQQARSLAERAVQELPEAEAATPATLLDLVELALVLGAQDRAVRHLDRLAGLVARQPMQRVLVRRRLTALQGRGPPVPAALVERFEPAHILIFTGTRAGQATFTPALEQAIGSAIARLFEELRPEIAFGSASAGSDLLFTEALLARGAELDLVLPFEREDFRDRFVAPFGPHWIERFERALARAHSVVEVCREAYLGDDVVLGFGNQVIDGLARLRGATLASPPHLAAIWDYLAEPAPGSPSDFIDHWGDPERLRLIDLDALRTSTGAEPAEPAGPAGGGPTSTPGVQRIATLLFADVVGYSQLRDSQLPAFWRFMQAVTERMRRDAPAPRMIDSWGDAILAVHERALDAADYALGLREGFLALDSRDFGLDQRLQLRIALHAGPVFESRHPLTGQQLVYGGNVNRAARIEPITIPDRVYASEQFVAMITAEESVAEAETRLQGGIHRPRHRCTYRGMLDLAKGYGTQALYEITPWRAEPGGAVELVAGLRLHVVLNNELGEHRRLAELFARLIAPTTIPADVASLFEIVFDEVLTNICRYAWADEALHAIEVEIGLDGGRIEAIFRDDGRPFDPLEAPPAALDADLDERSVGGLGIHLVRELMDEVRYTRSGDFNCLTIVKQVGQDGRDHDAREGAS